MDVIVTDIVKHASSYEDGKLVSDALLRAVDTDGFANVSFAGVDTITTSFLNGLLVRTLRLKGREFIFSKTKFSHLSRQVNEMIQTRFLRHMDEFDKR
jgi:hypothetical protein